MAVHNKRNNQIIVYISMYFWKINVELHFTAGGSPKDHSYVKIHYTPLNESINRT